MDNKNTYDGIRALSSAIVLQAYKDFNNYIAKFKNGKFDLNTLQNKIQEIIKFAKSDWFKELTDLKPEIFISKLKTILIKNKLENLIKIENGENENE